MPNAAPKHRVKRQAPRHVANVEETRESSNARGYGAAWRKIRKAFLEYTAERQAWHWACCVICLAQGRRVRATDVDHIVRRALGGTDDFDNLQALCHSCHSRKTAKEVGWRP